MAPFSWSQLLAVQYSPHSYGLDMQSYVEVLRGHGEEVLSHRLLRIRVEHSADAGGDVRQLVRRKARTAAEHHVLLGMRRSRKTLGRFIRAGPVIHYGSDDRSQPVPDDQHAETVLQRVAQDGFVPAGGLAHAAIDEHGAQQHCQAEDREQLAAGPRDRS